MRHIFILFLLCFSSFVFGQMGGDKVYTFLGVPTSARQAGLGGAPVSLIDNDFNLAAQNPALLSDTMDLSVVFNFAPYISGTKNSYIALAKSWKDVGNFSLGLNYLNYGTFEGYDQYETYQGTFTGSDMAIYAQYSRMLSPRISAGITIKPIFSHLESYSSSALLTDVGFNYNSINRLFSAGVVLRNYGTQFSNYGNNDLYKIRPDLAFCSSIKLAYAPFRFLITAQNLTQWDLTYTVVNTQNGSSVKIQDTKSYSSANKLLRHLVIGVEFLPSKNFYIDLSYNGKIRQELSVEQRRAIVGFAGGFGLRIKQFQVGYAFGKYHLASTASFLSLRVNLGQFAFAQKRGSAVVQ